jgi:hypothetical protein
LDTNPYEKVGPRPGAVSLVLLIALNTALMMTFPGESLLNWVAGCLGLLTLLEVAETVKGVVARQHREHLQKLRREAFFAYARARGSHRFPHR